MDSSPPYEKMLRLKIASEIVLGSQAGVAFSRAFYLEDLLIERILKENEQQLFIQGFSLSSCDTYDFTFFKIREKFNELSEACSKLLDQVQKFTEEVLENDSASPDLSPMTESSARCECSEMVQSLGTTHKPTLEHFQQKLIQAKARRQAKSSLLENISAQNNNLTSQFNSMTLGELLSEVHIPEFSCFINDSDFGVLEKLVDEWDDYRDRASNEFHSYEEKLDGFKSEIEKGRKMREYTCDMILAQITQQKHQNSQLQLYGTDTLKKKGLIHKVSTLLRRQSQKKDKSPSSPSSKSLDRDHSPEISSPGLSIAENSDRLEQTF